MDFLRYFRLQKVAPKIQSWTPRPRWIYRCLTSRKIAHFQSRISSKWLSAKSWHSFCPSKAVFSTDPQVHGSQNPLLYRELVIRPSDAIFDRFTSLHTANSQLLRIQRTQSVYTIDREKAIKAIKGAIDITGAQHARAKGFGIERSLRMGEFAPFFIGKKQ